MDTVEYGVCGQVAVKRDSTGSVVVAGDRIGNPVRVGVRIDHRDNRYFELLGLSDRNVFLVRIDDDQNVRQSAHVLDATQSAIELVAFAGEVEQLLLGQAQALLGQLFFKLVQALDRIGDGLPVRQHAAQPAVIDVMLAAALGGVLHDIAGLPLGADEQDAPAAGHHPAHRRQRLVQQGNGLFQVDDVHAVAHAEDVGRHLRIPAPGGVSEVDASFQQLTHGEGRKGHIVLFSG